MIEKSEKRPATRAEARALAHPLRLRILRHCLDESLTNRQLAERLGEQPATVLYHVRTLLREGFLVREPERRGRRRARELPYRSTRKSLKLQLGFDDAAHLAMIDAVRAELAEAGPEALLTMSRLGTRLPPERLDALLERIVELVKEASAADEEGGVPVGMLLLAHRRG
ncbi:MAG: winged helix-turn-helix domain-containing protein [Chloroflexota bacterium]|nr:winged helix-turn-helix domain-containing protein [Chloroflexota bacterium]